MIASSPTNIQPVLDTVGRARRAYGASDANIRLRMACLRSVASYGPLPFDAVFSVNRGTAAGRAVVDGRTVHVEDSRLSPKVSSRKARKWCNVWAFVHVGHAAAPRKQCDGTTHSSDGGYPFTEKQIKLLETFASQAVIAIENVRLFKELEDPNRDLGKL